MTQLPESSFPTGFFLSALLFAVSLGLATGFGQESAGTAAVFSPDDSAIVAVADGFEIRAGYVLKSLQVANPAAKDNLAGDIEPRLWAGAVEHLIQRQAVLLGLHDDPAAIGKSELKLEIEQIEKQLKSADTSLSVYLEQNGLTQSEFENELRWRLTWNRYLDRFLIAENVQKYFEQHRRDFDGTQLVVDQILWTMEADATEEIKAAVRDQAIAVFERLNSGDLLWEDAVQEYSVSPLVHDPGQSARLIGRNAPMPAEFSEAAFALDKEGISPPTESAIGIHIIRCLEIRSGKLTFDEVSDLVRAEMTERLFQHLVSRNRTGIKVEYRPGFPHLDDTGELVNR